MIIHPFDQAQWHVQLRELWEQDRDLLGHPECGLLNRWFTGEGSNPMSIVQNDVWQFNRIECATGDLEDKKIAESGGIYVPGDRFISLYPGVDLDPLTIVVFPSGTENYYTILNKEYTASTGRVDLVVRPGSDLRGVVYRRKTADGFNANDWSTTETYAEAVLTVNQSSISTQTQLLFGGYYEVDTTFFYVRTSEFKKFFAGRRPSTDDVIRMKDEDGEYINYTVLDRRFVFEQQAYVLLCRRYQT